MTNCSLMDKCGLTYSAWLNDDHPTVAQGSVKKKVCINRESTNPGGNCCQEDFLITVKNCSSFFIYNLVPSQGPCPFRYCGTD